MPDQSDVENALVGLIAATLFPGTAYQTPAAVAAAVPPWTVAADQGGTTTGSLTRVYRGWPVGEGLDADMDAGIANISVFPDQGMTRNTTRYQQEWEQTGTVTPTLTATVSGQQITIGGTAGADQVVGIAIGEGVLLAGYAYRLTDGLSLAAIAALFAASIPGATASGPTLTVQGVIAEVTVTADQPASQEVRRVEQRFRISFWCPTPQARDTLVSAVDAALAATPWLDASGAAVRLVYSTDYTIDNPKPDLWRRDICYHCEYPTTQTQQQPIMLFPGLSIGVARNPQGLAGGADILVQVGTTTPETTVFIDQNGNILTDAAGNLLAPVPT